VRACRVPEESTNPQIKGYVRPEEAAEKGVKAVLSRSDIGRHLTSEVVFSGDSLPGFSGTIEHPDGLVLADRFQPDGQDPPTLENENLTDNLAMVCGSRRRSLVGESLDLVVRTTSEN
jgi:hypothetical protein